MRRARSLVELIVAIVLAMAAEPLVQALERRGLRRGTAVGISFALARSRARRLRLSPAARRSSTRRRSSSTTLRRCCSELTRGDGSARVPRDALPRRRARTRDPIDRAGWQPRQDPRSTPSAPRCDGRCDRLRRLPRPLRPARRPAVVRVARRARAGERPRAHPSRRQRRLRTRWAATSPATS